MAQQPTSWLDRTTANIDATAFTGQQQVIGLSNGNILVVFADNTPQSPGVGRDIAGVIYDAEGGVVRDQFQINFNFVADEEQRPAIAATNDGGFIVVYQDDDAAGTSIRAERHDANGNAIDFTTVMQDPGAIDLYSPKVAVDLSDNSFLVTYEHNDANDGTIRGRKFDAAMNQVGGETILRTDDDPTNTAPGGDPHRHDTAVLADGSFVTVFDEDDVTGGLVDQGIEFRLSTATGANGTLKNVTGQNGIQETDAKVSALADGGFVVVWTEPEDPGIDQNNNIRARIYEADGTARTGSIIIAGDAATNFGEADVIGLEDGTFFVAWQDQTNERLQGRLLTAGGASVGGVLDIETANDPQTLNLGATTDGRILITYQTLHIAGPVHFEILDPRSGAVTVNEGDGQVTARLEGSTIVGSADSETLLGQDGDDIFQYIQNTTDSSNTDAIFGGGGVNTFEITTLLSERIVDLGTGVFALGDIGATGAVRATLHAIQNVTVAGAQDIRGSSAANVLTATGAFANDMLGMDGNDTISGGGGDDRLEGGTGNDSIDGGDGNDTIDGDTGKDTMNGGDGNDSYHVNGKNDVVIETNPGAAGGNDTVVSAASTFTLGSNIEDLVLTGSNNSDGIGNGLANRIDGNGGNNSLQGGGGDDTLAGSDGNDDLRGGTGADRMNGGDGKDRFFVDDAGDQTIETNADLATGGIDTVFSTLSRTLAANIENLRLQGSGDLNGNGNELANKLFGTSGLNVLQGFAGADTIDGKGGADTIDGGAGNDTLTGGGGGDVFRFAASDAGVDRILDFSQNFDRFDLSGGSFTALSTAPNGDAVLTHAGGTVRVATPPNLTLGQWNALVTSSGEISTASAATVADSPHVAFAQEEFVHLPHGEWLFA